METNETTQNPTLPDDLSPKQIAAVAALLAGKTVTDAAAEASVDRWTVHAWLREDFAFQAAMNRGRRDLQKSAKRRLAKMVHKALDAVEKALDGGDAKTAVEVLRDTRVLKDPFGLIGSDDPAELRWKAEERAAWYAEQQSDG